MAPSERGFSLVESVVACGLLLVGVLSLAQLFVIAVSTNVAAKHVTLAALLASQKLEELRSAVEPTAGIDFIDAGGRSMPSSGHTPPGSVFVRRWTVDPIVSDPANATIVRVVVAPVAGEPRLAAVSLVSVR